jgi:hypothetical protein
MQGSVATRLLSSAITSYLGENIVAGQSYGGVVRPRRSYRFIFRSRVER